MNLNMATLFGVYLRLDPNFWPMMGNEKPHESKEHFVLNFSMYIRHIYKKALFCLPMILMQFDTLSSKSYVINDV